MASKTVTPNDLTQEQRWAHVLTCQDMISKFVFENSKKINRQHRRLAIETLRDYCLLYAYRAAEVFQSDNGAEFSTYCFWWLRSATAEWWRTHRKIYVEATNENLDKFFGTRMVTPAINEDLQWDNLTATVEPSLKKVLELRFHEQLTFKEIARELRVCRNTVRKMYNRAIGKIRRDVCAA